MAKKSAGNAGGAKSLQNLLDRLDHWLAEHRRDFKAGLLPGANTAVLESLQTALGLPIPDSLHTLLTWHNGQSDDFLGGFEQDWQLMNADRIAAAKRDLDQNAATTGWRAIWIPFLDNDAGDFLCLDTSQQGAPVRAFCLGSKEHPVIAPSLEAWLEDFVTNVEKGNYVEDTERGTFLRKRQRG